jgi:hypothetical protein
MRVKFNMDIDYGLVIKFLYYDNFEICTLYHTEQHKQKKKKKKKKKETKEYKFENSLVIWHNSVIFICIYEDPKL